MFTIEEVIYDINGLKSSHKKFTIARLFTIDWFTIARFNCITVFKYRGLSNVLIMEQVEMPLLENFI